ncbi:hypothetical protein HDV00_001096 [Rhizophlyctis rosea]|nr:hypothetical protein HDV00_001096 [Rhizophlyctis rosea]
MSTKETSRREPSPPASFHRSQMVPQSQAIPRYSSILLALLSSSCCVIQLLLNYLSLGCAGFAILTPYRPILTTLTVTLLTYNLYTYGWNRKTATASLVSVLLMTSPEIVASHNTNTLSRTFSSLVGKLGTLPIYPSNWLLTPPQSKDLAEEATQSGRLCTMYEFTVLGMKCEGCASRVKGALDGIPEVDSSEVYFSEKTVMVKVPVEAGVDDNTATKIIKSKIAAVDFEYRTNLVKIANEVPCEI